jgi:hypothetical protein
MLAAHGSPEQLIFWIVEGGYGDPNTVTLQSPGHRDKRAHISVRYHERADLIQACNAGPTVRPIQPVRAEDI